MIASAIRRLVPFCLRAPRGCKGRSASGDKEGEIKAAFVVKVAVLNGTKCKRQDSKFPLYRQNTLAILETSLRLMVAKRILLCITSFPLAVPSSLAVHTRRSKSISLFHASVAHSSTLYSLISPARSRTDPSSPTSCCSPHTQPTQLHYSH